jgi:1-deoxy-D-xylulose-5-phosphate reductoisomerase
MKRIAVLGSTGSIGQQILDVVRWHSEEFKIVALAAGRPSDLFETQVREFRPRVSYLTSVDGAERLVDIACDPGVDLLVVATSGTVGFHLVTAAAAASGAELLPIDSEHSAIWQCLQGEQPYAERVRRLLLTASGGAFRDRASESLAAVSPAEALQHPTWSMGPKITIDSATLMNKGLEVIEAHWLFGLDFDHIDVLIHHQSVIHSLVEFVDGSVKAQLSLPDMRLPIQYALAHPRRLVAPVEPLNLAAIGQLTFSSVDSAKYPCLRLAYDAGRHGGTYPTVLNAANEIAVERFLDNHLGFTQIAELIDAALQAHAPRPQPTLQEVMEADNWAREFSREWRR